MPLRLLIAMTVWSLAGQALAQDIPPLPVHVTVQRCLFGADGTARKTVEGSDWRLDCHSARQLKELLRVVPNEDASWNFF